MQPDSLVNLPEELLYMVFGHLTLNDLAACVRVSKVWSTFFTPFLWRSVSVTSRRAFTRFMSPEAQLALARNAGFVQVLTTVYIPVIECMVILRQESSTTMRKTSSSQQEMKYRCLCTGLRSLDLGRLWRSPSDYHYIKDCQGDNSFSPVSNSTHQPAPPFTPEQELAIRRLVLSNRQLKSIRIGRCIDHGNRLLRILDDTHLPHLRDLHLFIRHGEFAHWSNKMMDFPHMKLFLEQLPQTLERLTFGAYIRPFDGTAGAMIERATMIKEEKDDEEEGTTEDDENMDIDVETIITNYNSTNSPSTTTTTTTTTTTALTCLPHPRLKSVSIGFNFTNPVLKDRDVRVYVLQDFLGSCWSPETGSNISKSDDDNDSSDRVRFNCQGDYDDGEDMDDSLLHSDQWNLHALRKMTLSGQKYDETFLMQEKTFRSFIGYPIQQAIIDAMEGTFDGEEEDDEDEARFLDVQLAQKEEYKGCRIIDLSQCEAEYMDDGIVDAILGHGSTLRKLVLGRSSAFVSGIMIQDKLLTRLPCLKIFDAALEPMDGWKLNSVLEAMDIAEDRYYSEDEDDDNDNNNINNINNSNDDDSRKWWACERTLQVLKVEISRVPRPDLQQQQLLRYELPRIQRPPLLPLELRDAIMGTVEESHAIQRRIYEQLGRLEKLQVLVLGHEVMNPDRSLMEEYQEEDEEEEEVISRLIDQDFQWLSLEMSLESGLDLMGGLKELRVLNVSRMAHRIGVAELEWMQINWPRLENVIGLFDPLYPIPSGREVLTWLRENEPVWGWQYRTMEFELCGTRRRDELWSRQ
ncbi:hypothetical protein BG004_005972 [Podila humilis]|nr:hypothetical protein BG004_005972 [Podila humilis]